MFTIRAQGAAEGRFYIQSAKLNGKPLERPWIRHQEITAGGELELTMGAAPNKAWAAPASVAPPSLSTN